MPRHPRKLDAFERDTIETGDCARSVLFFSRGVLTVIDEESGGRHASDLWSEHDGRGGIEPAGEENDRISRGVLPSPHGNAPYQ